MGMNPEVKAAWLAALRSGEYRQGQTRLTTIRDDGTFRHCCLGVLCEIAADAGIVARFPEPGLKRVGYGGDESESPATHDLPLEVIHWAGLTDSNPNWRIKLEDGEASIRSAISMNDGDLLDFAQIADEFEANL